MGMDMDALEGEVRSPPPPPAPTKSTGEVRPLPPALREERREEEGVTRPMEDEPLKDGGMGEALLEEGLLLLLPLEAAPISPPPPPS